MLLNLIITTYKIYICVYTHQCVPLLLDDLIHSSRISHLFVIIILEECTSMTFPLYPLEVYPVHFPTLSYLRRWCRQRHPICDIPIPHYRILPITTKIILRFLQTVRLTFEERPDLTPSVVSGAAFG